MDRVINAVLKWYDEEEPWEKLTADKVKIVWYSKCLKNWKATAINIDRAGSEYFEITYNGETEEIYIDRYIKESHRVFKEDE